MLYLCLFVLSYSSCEQFRSHAKSIRVAMLPFFSFQDTNIHLSISRSIMERCACDRLRVIFQPRETGRVATYEPSAYSYAQQCFQLIATQGKSEIELQSCTTEPISE